MSEREQCCWSLRGCIVAQREVTLLWCVAGQDRTITRTDLTLITSFFPPSNNRVPWTQTSRTTHLPACLAANVCCHMRGAAGTDDFAAHRDQGSFTAPLVFLYNHRVNTRLTFRVYFINTVFYIHDYNRYGSLMSSVAICPFALSYLGRISHLCGCMILTERFTFLILYSSASIISAFVR